MNEFLEAFLQEARELVEQASGDLLAVERRHDDKGRIDSAFRAFHTLKGSAGIVEFDAMARLLHAAEDVLGRVRNGTEPVTGPLISRCLACLDQVLVWLRYIEEHGKLPEDDAGADRLVAAFAGASEPPRAASEPNSDATDDLPKAARELLETQITLLESEENEGARGRFASAANVVLNVLRACGRTEQAAAFEGKYQECARGGTFGGLAEAVRALCSVTAPQDSASERPFETASQEASIRTLRVDVERVDALVKLAGEMTIVRNALAHAVRLAQNGEASVTLAALLKSQHAALDRLVDELQISALNIRVLPMRHVFQRFPRLVRDLAGQLGKTVRLIIDGEDTEADKTVVENLAEPLIHVIRNAIDHGVEAEAQRVKHGKAATGTIRISAHREGDNVIVVVADDGAGIDSARIRAIAAERQVLPPDAIQSLSDEEAVNLIFLPGFSTASVVTGLSGRGVGMDAVRSAVERLGGRVSIQSNPGHGTNVRFSLPFSVIVSQVMTASAAGQDFGVPLEHVVETIRVPANRVIPVGEAHAFVLRDVTIPLIDLAQIVGGAKSFPSLRPDYDVMIVAVEGQLTGLVVDRLGERMDVMLKPLDGLIAGTPGIAGTTLVADGRVLLVLDLPELLQ